MLIETVCKPSEKCARCKTGSRRICETHYNLGRPHVYRFTHHIEGAMFEDCEDSKYERVRYSAYEHPAGVATNSNSSTK